MVNFKPLGFFKTIAGMFCSRQFLIFVNQGRVPCLFTPFNPLHFLSDLVESIFLRSRNDQRLVVNPRRTLLQSTLSTLLRLQTICYHYQSLPVYSSVLQPASISKRKLLRKYENINTLFCCLLLKCLVIEAIHGLFCSIFGSYISRKFCQHPEK